MVARRLPGPPLTQSAHILVPDSTFLSHPGTAHRELRTLSRRSFETVSASDASAALLTDRTRDEAASEWLILDEVAEFDGLERLIVLGVGLDARIDDDSRETLQTRSLLYRAMTRAHMLVLVVNKLVRGGFLEYTGRLKLNDAFDPAAERDRMDVRCDGGGDSVAARTVSCRRMLFGSVVNEEPAALALSEDLDAAKPLADAATEAVDAWIRQGLAIRQAVGNDRVLPRPTDVAAALRTGTNLKAASRAPWRRGMRRSETTIHRRRGRWRDSAAV